MPMRQQPSLSISRTQEHKICISIKSIHHKFVLSFYVTEKPAVDKWIFQVICQASTFQVSCIKQSRITGTMNLLDSILGFQKLTHSQSLAVSEYIDIDCVDSPCFPMSVLDNSRRNATCKNFNAASKYSAVLCCSSPSAC